MVKEEELPPNTGPLRTQIGLARKRLEDAIKDVEEVLVAAQNANTQATLVAVRDRLPDVDAVMNDRHGHLAALDLDWQEHCARSYAESKLRKNWLKDYGDYNLVLDQAEEVHREAKITLASVCKAISKFEKEQPNPPPIRRRNLSPLPANSDAESTVRLEADPFHQSPLPAPRRLASIPTIPETNQPAATPFNDKMTLPNVPPEEANRAARIQPTEMHQPEVKKNIQPKIEKNIQSESPGKATFEGPVSGNNTNQEGNQAGLLHTNIVPQTHFLQSLPPIQLRPYHGNPLEFAEFWALYNNTIHSLDPHRMSNCIKFSYLMTCLEGQAKDAVAGLSITDSNYPIAIDILHTRFGKPAIIQQHLFRVLQNLPPSNSSTISLRKTIDEVEKTVRQLGQFGNNTNSLMESVILSKFPSGVVTSTLRAKQSSNDWSIEKCMFALNSFVNERETVEALCADTVLPLTNRSQFSHHDPPRFNPIAHPLPLSHTQIRLRCVFCNGEHMNRTCPMFTNSESRAIRAAENHLCFRCLGKHAIADCLSRSVCKRCGSHTHSTLLCQIKDKEQPMNKIVTEPPKYQQKPQYHSNLRTGGNAVPLSQSEPRRNAQGRPALFHADQTPTFIGKEPIKQNGANMNVITDSNQRTPNNNYMVLIRPLHLSHIVNSIDNYVNTHAICDTGATHSYVSNDLVHHLKLSPKDTRNVSTTAFGSNKKIQLKCKVYDLPIPTVHNSVIQVEVLSNDTICGPIPISCIHPQAFAFKPDGDYITPHIIFSNTDFWKFVTGGPQEDDNGRYLPTIIGPVFLADASSPPLPALTTTTVLSTTANPTPTPMSDLEPESMTMQPTFHDNKYTVKLPFKNNEEPKDDHFFLCLHRFRTVHKNLKDKNLLNEYNGQIQQLINNEVVIPAPPILSINGKIPKQRFLSHHPTFHPQKGKLRIVYDGSAKTKSSPSLNDHLHTGENLLPLIRDILIELRSLRNFFIADIKSAFHTISVDPNHQRFLRFIWLKDHTKPPLNSNLLYLQFDKLPFGLTCSPSLLAVALQTHLNKYGDFGKAIFRRTYVDNLIIDFDDSNDGIQKYHRLQDIFERASMKLHEFNSNDPTVNAFLQDEGHTTPPIQTFLGISVDFVKDELITTIPALPSTTSSRLTKRIVSSVISSVFDPLGFVEPAILPARLFLQRLWKLKLNWDEDLPDNLKDDFLNLSDTWGSTKITIPRLYDIKTAQNTQLHIFVDASQDACGLVAYLTCKYTDRTQTFFITSKSRLAPSKTHRSTPSLEFNSILMGAKTAQEILKVLGKFIHDTTIWSDSICALHWSLKDTPPNSLAYNKNRHKELVSLRKGIQLRHIPGELNIADISSRGCSLQELANNREWINGPEWLNCEEKWPVNILQEYTNEIPDKPIEAVHLTTTSTQVPLAIDWTRFSTWTKAERVTNICLRFLALKSPKFAKRFQIEGLRSSNISPTEESRLVFPIIIKCMQQEYPPSENESKEYGLCIRNQGLIHQQTRRRQPSDPTSTIDPLFMPRKHPLTALYIQNVHRRHMHSSPEYTFHILRQHVFIPRARTVVKHTLSLCCHCKRFHAKPFRLPSYPPFPQSRTTPTTPFTNIGIDLMGPIYLRPNSKPIDQPRQRGRPPAEVRTKSYVAIFACFATRGIQLEVVSNQTPEAFLHAFRRYCSRRGAPLTILSDQALNFVVTSSLFTSDPSSGNCNPTPPMESFLKNANINWKFIPAMAPWFGSTYERLIKVVKTSLHRTIGRKILNEDELRSLVYETEFIVNKRPLTYLPNDDTKVLSPSDFLNLTKNDPPYILEPDGEEEWIPETEAEMGRNKLISLWKQSSQLTNKFWTYWQLSYLSELQQRTKREHHHPRLSNDEEPQINEVVLIEDSLPRNTWKLGRISALHSSPYRSATVEMGQPNGTTRSITRPLNKLCSLELRAFVTLICFFLFLTPANACSDVATLSGQASECQEISKDELICTFRTSTLISISPMSDTVCLNLQVDLNGSVGVQTLILQPSGLRYTCAPTTLGFTRDVEFDTVYSHRCESAKGSQCINSFCENVRPTTTLTDISKEYAAFPGYNACVRSCGCLWCGCGYCDPSCLFYRVYMKPKNDILYRLFNCLSFIPNVDIVVTLENETDSFILSPNSPVDHDNVTLTLSSTSYVPTNLLNMVFLYNYHSNSTYVLSTAVLAQKTNPLSIKCPNQRTARSFECSFDQNHCQCQTSYFSVICYCPTADYSVLESASHRLPLSREGSQVKFDHNKVTALTNHGIQLLVSLDKPVTLLKYKSECQITFDGLEGCQDCSGSPTMNITCQTLFSETSVTSECPTLTVAKFKCTNTSTSTSVNFQASSKLIEETCLFKCGGSTYKINVAGKLTQATNQDPVLPDNGSNTSETPDANFWESLKNLILWPFSALSNLFTSLGVLVGSVALILCLCYCQPILLMIVQCCRRIPHPFTHSHIEPRVRIRLSRLQVPVPPRNVAE